MINQRTGWGSAFTDRRGYAGLTTPNDDDRREKSGMVVHLSRKVAQNLTALNWIFPLRPLA